MPMQIYAAEASIADLILSDNKVVYASDVMISDDPIDASKIKLLEANLVEGKDRPGLFGLKSILVSTGMNKNHCYFDCGEVWAGRETAEDKPFNIEHDCHDIIGHITGNSVVDDDMKVIDPTTEVDKLPSKFHIMTSAVIYEHWKEQKKEDEIAKIIGEIKEGKWFVSVEANFSNFDFILGSEDGYKVVYRNQETAFLTPYLPKYKGSGYYNGQKVGQFIRNITFCGKGLVRKPANPESIILSSYTEPVSKALGYITSSNEIISKEKSEMSDDLKNENTQLKQTVASLEAQLKTINEKNIEAKIVELQDQIKVKDAKIAEVSDKLTANASEIIELKKSHQDVSAKFATASAELDKVALINKKSDRSKVMAKEIGVTIEDANSLVDNLDSLNDEAFTKFVAASKEKLAKKETKTEANTEPVKTPEELAKIEQEANKTLETATASKDDALVTAANVESLRKNVKNFLSKRESK